MSTANHPSHPPHPSRRAIGRLRRLAAALLASAVVAVLWTPSAHAGIYHVYVCKLPDGTPIPLDRDTWTPSSQMPFSAAAESCASGGPIALFMGSAGAPLSYPVGDAASWVARLPGGLVSAYARRTISTTGGADVSASPEFVAVSRWPETAFDACAAYQGCQAGVPAWGDDPDNRADYNPPGEGSELKLLVRCGGDPGSSGSCGNTGAPRVTAVFTRLDLAVRDSSPPSGLPGSVLGTATNSTAVQRGTLSFQQQVSDSGSGIYRAEVWLGGREISTTTPDTRGGRCVDAGADPANPYEFTTAQPCPRSVEMQLKVDTTLAPDGRQPFKVDLIDASGNRRTVYDSSLLIDNIPAPKATIAPTVPARADLRPGDTLSALDGVWQGTGITFTRRWQRSAADGSAWSDIPNATGPTYTVTSDDVGRTLRVVVTATNIEGVGTAASEATAKVKTGSTVVVSSLDPGAVASPGGGNGGGGNPSTGQLVVDREQRTVDVRYGAKIVITGRLVDADGQPIADAAVDVFEQLAVTAASWIKIGTVKTDSQGGYVFRPRTSASRRLRFAYADRRDAGDYRATREVFVSVTAGMLIRARRHVVRARGLIKLAGRVQIDQLPAAGTWVEVQVLDAGVWRTVATRRTSSKGGWTFKHRLSRSSGITFRFRARLRPSGDLASAEAKSRPVKVRVM